MRLLFLSPWFPFPPTNGSELRIDALIRGLAAEHRLTLISFQRRAVTDEDLRAARQLVDEVHLIPWRAFAPNGRRARLGFLSRRPRSIVDTYSTEMAECIRRQIRSGGYDVVIASELVTAAYADEYEAVPALLDDLEIGIYDQGSAAAGPPHRRARQHLTWAKQRAWVRGLLPRFAACTVVSEHERALLREVAPGYDAVEIIPNCIDLPAYAGVRVPKEANTLIFTGAFTYDVNHDAMVWFLGEVYPLVRRVAPDVRVIITGDHANLPLPPAKNVMLTGCIDDVKPAVAAATISLVPIRQGGGTRLKILEAMALGTPVVSTTKGAEGLDVVDGEHLLLADTPEAFAGAVIQLLQDGELRQRLATHASGLVAAAYNWQGTMPRFLELIKRTVAS